MKHILLKILNSLTIIISIFLLPVIAFGQEPLKESVPPGKKAAILSRIKEATATTQTLAGEFTQERHLDMLKNASVSSGKFYYKNPDSLRWEIYQPVVQGFVLNGDKGRRWQGKSSATKSFDLKKEPVIKIISDQVFAWARADFNKLEAGYDIVVEEESPIALKLSPHSSAEKKYLAFIRLIFSSTENYVSAIEIHEPGGDYTLVKFSGMKINNPLPEDIF
jgi:outer membrane lipoprotein-sorting protein